MNLWSLAPYSLAQSDKEALLRTELETLTLHHASACAPYGQLLRSLYGHTLPSFTIDTLPFLPVRLFKQFQLTSVPAEKLQRTMTSSGTTGQQVSQIYLDRETSTLQSKVLAKIVADFIGKERLPMLILDTASVISNRAMFSARGAGILGFSLFARDKCYALDADMNINRTAIEAFLQKHAGQKILLFGFTYIIWAQVLSAMNAQGYHPDLSNGILIHGGGWKKLASQNISQSAFRQALHDACQLSHVHDYYGMVEQTGTIYMQCEQGHLHAPLWGDVIIRNPSDFSVQPMGEKGLVQVVSLLPHSYPGHSLLTEDEGTITSVDTCPCGRKGKTLALHGRIARAEVRGCSDTYEH